MESLPRSLIAEIIVERVRETRQRGSGYLVAPGLVLTANHVVADAAKIGVWFGAPDELRPEAAVAVEPARIVAAPWADLALLPVDAQSALAGEPALLGRLDRESTVPVTAIAAGFPRFKLRPAPGREDVQLRERHDAIGTIMPGSDMKTGTYELTGLHLQPDDDPEPLQHSPWEGMSGAAVWANGRLIGVVAQHHPGEGTGSLTVRPIVALFQPASAAQLANWQAALGPRLPGRAWDLWLVTPEGLPHRAIERALEAARELAPAILESREADLAQLDAFVDSEEQWLWLQAAAFAGKTALVTWFASHAPAGVNVVSCFLRRTTGENTADFALDTLNAQLAAWSDRSGYVPAVYPSEKKREFPRLLADAARAGMERGRRLLVLIDGADEYDTSATGLRLHDWLPDAGTLPPHAALLLTSRSGSDIELPATHPLHNHRHTIAASEVAGKIEHLARRELEQALADTNGIQYPLLGFLAAASGGLTNRDLAALLTRVGHKVYSAAINTTIQTSLNRMLIQSAGHAEANERLNTFAHDMLLASARQMFADDLPAFEGQLLDWCQHFKDRHWPKDTPVYVLSQYPRHLVRAERCEKLFALVVDQEWYHRHMQVDPTGHSYLEAIDIIWTTAETVDEAQTKAATLAVSLGVEAHCALTSASVRNLSSRVSLDLMVALIECHYWSERQAWRVASLNPDPRERGYILAGLASHLKEPVLTTAVRDALCTMASITDEFAKVWQLEELAPYLPKSLINEALQLARSLPVRLFDNRKPRVAALAAVLPRVASLGWGHEALEEALALEDEDDRARVLAQLGPQLPADLKQKALHAVRAMEFSIHRAEGQLVLRWMRVMATPDWCMRHWTPPWTSNLPMPGPRYSLRSSRYYRWTGSMRFWQWLKSWKKATGLACWLHSPPA